MKLNNKHNSNTVTLCIQAEGYNTTLLFLKTPSSSLHSDFHLFIFKVSDK